MPASTSVRNSGIQPPRIPRNSHNTRAGLLGGPRWTQGSRVDSSAYDVVDGSAGSIWPHSMTRDLPHSVITLNELVREFLVRANTMLDFAGHLGLIEPEDD